LAQLNGIHLNISKLLSLEIVTLYIGASSQKTSMLGGVAQILIYSKSSPYLVDVVVRPKSQHL